MKKIIQSTLLAVALALCVLPAVSLTGCTTTQQAVTYKTLAAVGHTTDAALKAYLDLVVSGHVSSAGVARVGSVYAVYQGAYNSALQLAQLNPNSTAPENVVQLSKSVLDVITEMKGVK